jgi:hypothetical protein
VRITVVKKIKTLRTAVGKFRLPLICLQEIHGLSLASKGSLERNFPEYRWFHNWGESRTKGVAIGVKNCRGIPQPFQAPITDKRGTLMYLNLTIEKRETRVFLIYKPNKEDIGSIMKDYWMSLPTRRDTIVAGDFNLDRWSPKFTEFNRLMSLQGMARLDLPS